MIKLIQQSDSVHQEIEYRMFNHFCVHMLPAHHYGSCHQTVSYSLS